MKTVWVLTIGEYSDHHVAGVFSTQEEAKNRGKLLSSRYYGAYEVEEYPINSPKNPYPEYIAWVNKDGTSLTSEKTKDTFLNTLRGEFYGKLYARGTTAKKALKNVCDYRAKYLAEKAGI